MPGLLAESISQAMRDRPPQTQPEPIATGGTPDDPLAGLEPATDEEEQYVNDVWDKVAERLYRQRTTNKISDMIAKADDKVNAVVMASLPFLDVASDVMLQMPVEPVDDAGPELLTRIVDAVLDIADESGAAPYSDEMAMAALTGVRQAYANARPDLYGGGPDNGQPDAGPAGLAGGSGGLPADGRPVQA